MSLCLSHTLLKIAELLLLVIFFVCRKVFPWSAFLHLISDCEAHWSVEAAILFGVEAGVLEREGVFPFFFLLDADIVPANVSSLWRFIP